MGEPTIREILESGAHPSDSSISIPSRPVAWRAHPGFQRRAMQCPIREILIGGAKGSGKSALIGPLALKHVLKYGRFGAVVLVLRQNYQELTDLEEKVKPLFKRAGGRYSSAKHMWRFPEGGRVKFGHLERGVGIYWGQEYTLVLIDELTRCIATEADYLKLLGSLRSGSPEITKQVVGFTNPGGPGHSWVQARFMVGVKPHEVQHDKQGLARVFLPGRLEDNPTLDPVDPETGERTGEYRASLNAWPEAERRAYLDGDWNAFTGQVFKLVPGVHTWTWTAFKARVEGETLGKDGVPLTWTRYRLLDWGFAHPYCVLWIAVDHDGRAWVYREMYGVKRNGDGTYEANVGSSEEGAVVARAIKAIEDETGERITAAYAGPDLWHRKGRQMGDERQFASWFEEEGVFFTPWDASPGTRLSGKMALHERLRVDLDTQGTPVEGELPGIVFLSEACPHTVRTLPMLTYDEHQPELVSKKAEDHPYDVVKAFCLLYAWAPQRDKRTVAQRLRDDHKRRTGTTQTSGFAA